MLVRLSVRTGRRLPRDGGFLFPGFATGKTQQRYHHQRTSAAEGGTVHGTDLVKVREMEGEASSTLLIERISAQVDWTLFGGNEEKDLATGSFCRYGYEG